MCPFFFVAALFAAVCRPTVAAPALGEPQPPLAIKGIDGAYVDCPCINHHNGTSEASLAFAALVEKSSAVQSGSLVLPKTFVIVPRDYGSATCRPWDKDGVAVPECSAFEPPSFCSLPWCFVDPGNCHPRRRPKSSRTFSGLYVSYYNCGHVYDYVPGQEYWASLAPVYVFSHGLEIRPTQVDGWSAAFRTMVKFASSALTVMQVPKRAIVYRQLSNESLARHTSTYSACVDDLVVGSVDLCVGDYWDTPDRRLMKAAFSNTIYSEMVYLYTRVVSEDLSVAGYFYQPLRPFSGALWALILGVVMASGLVLLFLEHGEADGDFPKSGYWFHAAVHGTYLSFGSLVNASAMFNPKTLSGKLFVVGLAFFLCVVIASFTANTASFLIYVPTQPRVQSLQAAVEAGMAVCMPEPLRGLITASYPELSSVGISITDGEDLLQGLVEGSCDATILPETTLTDAHARGEHCQIQAVGRPLLSFPIGMYVSLRLQHAFNWAVAERRVDGTWAALQKQVFADSRCEVDSYATPKQLQAHHMMSNCTLLLLCFAASVVLKCLKRVEQSAMVQKVEEGVINGVLPDVEEVMQSGRTSLDEMLNICAGPRSSLRAEALADVLRVPSLQRRQQRSDMISPASPASRQAPKLLVHL